MHVRSRVSIAYTISLVFILVTVLSYILIRLYFDILSGGHPWRQGDWLINNQAHPVRRGFLGSLILSISDSFSLNPLFLLGMIQAILCMFVLSSMILLVVRLDPNTRVLWAALSPGFVLMFWFLDFDASLKKEMLVYLSYAILILGITFNLKKRVLSWLSSLVFIFAVFAHEGNIFFLPFFLVVLYIVDKEYSNKQRHLLIPIVIIGSLSGLGYAIAFSRSADPTAICNELLQRGFSEYLCKGAILYLDHDLGRAVGFVKQQLLDTGLYIFYLVSYFLSLMPLFFLRPVFISKRIYFFGLVIGIILFLPLFIIAYDWGRWISFYVTSITVVLLMRMNLRPDFYPLNVDNTTGFKVFVFLHCFLWNMWGCCEGMGIGVAGFIGRTVSELLVDA